MSFLLRQSTRVPTSSSILKPINTRTFTSTRPSQLARMTLIGRLGTDPELTENTRSGSSMVRYVIGTSTGTRDNRQTSWFRVASFLPEGPQRDFIMGLQKGTLVYVECDARMKVYEDSNGKKQSSLDLIQTKIEVLKRPTSQDDTTSAPAESTS